MQSGNSEHRGPPHPAPLSAEEIARIVGPNTVYIREVGVDELKGLGVIPVDAPIPAAQKFFALHAAADGRRVAVVDNRDMAFMAARQHELEPVSVH